jgi:hypothetical protein
MRKLRQLCLTIVFLAAFALVLSLDAFAPSTVLAKSPQDNAFCLMESSSGQVLNLERICGASSSTAKANLAPVKATATSGRQVMAHLEWRRQNPSKPASLAPSPYDAQATQNFDRILYGN